MFKIDFKDFKLSSPGRKRLFLLYGIANFLITNSVLHLLLLVIPIFLATIIELDIPNRKVSLSVKQAQIDEEKTLIKKFGKDAKSSGATLKDIFNKALSITKSKKKK